MLLYSGQSSLRKQNPRKCKKIIICCCCWGRKICQTSPLKIKYHYIKITWHMYIESELQEIKTGKIKSKTFTFPSQILLWPWYLIKVTKQFRRQLLFRQKKITFAVTLTLNTEQSNSGLQFATMMYNQTDLGCKRISCSVSTVEKVMFWLNKPSLWP